MTERIPHLVTNKESADAMMALLCSEKEKFWQDEGAKKALALFHAAAKRVPAYKDFLQKEHIDPERIITIADLQLVPPVDKNNYLRQYPLEALCWGGTLKGKSLVFTATSGSTGTPFYFPRSEVLDWQSAVEHRTFLDGLLHGTTRSTLVIDAFGMGVWIGGLLTYQAFRHLSIDPAYPITLITPGTNKKEIFEALKNLSHQFDQTIICAYPPFLKDILDEGETTGILWREMHLKLLCAAESFSEDFRDHLAAKVGIRNVYCETTNIYGSADLGTMAKETPLSIFVRRAALNNKDLFRSVFPLANKLPTLAQFNPLFTHFEAPEGRVLVTAYNVLPLIRYAIGDSGTVMQFGNIVSLLDEHHVDLKTESRAHGFDQTVQELPFVAIYERSDFSTKLYGAIIYPEHVREALITPHAQESLTGKFTLATKHDTEHNEYLEINIELRKGSIHSPDLERRVVNWVMKALLEKNAEYHYLHTMTPERIRPTIVFWEYGHPQYFQSGTKQQWVLK